MNNLKYTIELDAKGKLIPELKIVRQQMDDVAASAKRAGGQFQKLTDICGKLTKINWAATVENVRNVVDSLSSFSGTGTDFQQGMADLQAITGLVGKELDAVSEAARRVGKESGLGARGAVDAFTLLASQISVDQIGLKGLMQLQKETVTLAQAGGLSMEEAATAMAATINQFGLEVSEAARVVNVLAAGSKYGAAEVADLAQSFRITGATAAAAGLSVEQTAAALEVLSQSNLKGSESGTALRNIILKLQTTLGMDLSSTGLANALDALRQKLEDVTFLAKTFGAENIAAAQYLITNADAVRQMTDAVTGTNVAQEQAAIRTNTLAEQQKRIQANIDDLKISLFEATNGYVGYASALGDTAVMVSQSLPLFSLLRGGVAKLASVAGGLAVAGWLKLSATVKSAAATMRASSLTIQFMGGMLAMMPGRIAAFCKALTLQKVATAAAAAAQKVLNIALSANPVGLVIAAITTLVAGLVMAYKHCDRFREIVDSWVVGFKSLFKWVGKAWDAVKQFFGFGDEMKAAAEATEETANAMSSLSSSSAGGATFTAPTLQQNTNLSTIEGLTNKINALREAQNKASLENAVNLEKEIRLYQEKLNLLQLNIVKGANPEAQQPLPLISAGEAPRVEMPAVKLPFSLDMEELNRVLDALREKVNNAADEVKEITVVSSRQLTGMISTAFSGLGEALVSGNGLEALKQVLVTIMDMLQQFGTALIAAGTASIALKAVAWSGIGAVIAGGALVAATAAAKAALQKAATPFANGGIVSGPTYALVGEYAGARNNPEVIAPLDKLRNLIASPFTTDGLYLETKVRGKDLYVALRSVEYKNNRTR